MKKAILILGPEASGTKITQNIMIKCFGAAGNYGNCGIKGLGKDLITIKYSLPSGIIKTNDGYVNPSELYQLLKNYGYEDIRLVITSRDWWYMDYSHRRQTKETWNNERSREDSFKMIRRCYATIFDFLASHPEVPFIYSNYENLIYNHENHIKHLGDLLDLELKDINGVQINNGNKKYNQ